MNNNTSYTYDAASRRGQLVDAKNQTTQYAYDALNRLASISYLTDGTTVNFGYDALGNRLVMTDTVGSTRYTYDSLYRLTQVTDPFAQTIGYQYDAGNNRTNLTYPDGKVVTSTYNALNLLSTVKDWASKTTSYDYDNANRLITTTLPNNVVSLDSYDNANRLTHLSHTQVLSGVTLSDYQFALDGVGNRTRITETLQSPAGGVIQPMRPSGTPFVGVPDVPFSLPDGADLNNVTYQLYLPLIAGGNSKPVNPPVPKLGGSASNIVISEVRTRGPNGVTDEFVELFNPTDSGIAIGGWLVRGSSATGAVSTRATISNSVTLQPGQHYLVAHTGYSGSVTRDQSYASDVPDTGGFAIVSGTLIIDQVGFGAGSAYKEGTPLTALTTNINRSYARNGGGCTDTNNNSADFTLINPSAPQNKASPFTPCSPTTTSTVLQYAYDPLYRLTSGIYSGTTTVYTFAYGYDGVGNRTTQTRTVTNTQVIAYSYDNANRLTNVGGQAYSWDANGNLLNDGASVYAYDQANRLKTLTQTATVYSFAYNGVGDRLKQIIAGTLTTYTLDLNAGLTQVLADGGNRYVYGNGRVAQYAGANASYFLTDGLGSVRQLADNTGLVTLAERYDPFGAALSSAGSGTSEFGFAGEQTDATGLEYLRARYYAPGQGRFFQRDSWPGDQQRPQTWDLYSYAWNNPVKYQDPTGRISEGADAIEADITVRDLLNGRNIAIDKDWGQQNGRWNTGLWEIKDLRLVSQAVDEMGAAIGEGFRAMTTPFGSIRITRVKDGGGLTYGDAHITLGDYVFNQPHVSDEERDFKARVAVVHELAHAWDAGTVVVFGIGGNISARLGGAIGKEKGPTAYAQTNCQEDWAESVAAYIYSDYTRMLNDPYRNPNYAGEKTARGNNPANLDPLHRAYVQLQVDALNGYYH